MSDIHGFQVELDNPYDLDVTVDSWIYPDIQPVPEMKRPGEFARCIQIQGTQIPIRVQQLRKGARPSLMVQWPAKYGAQHEAITSLVEWLLGWDVDTRPVLAAIKQDSVIAHLAQPLRGLRPYSQPTLFEALVKAVLQQQVSFRSANQVTRRLVLAHGPQCQLGDRKLYGFPTLKTLAKLSETDLRASKVGYKAPYLVEICEQLTTGSLQLDKLVQSGTETAIQDLNAIRGVGVWTAELAILTGLRRLDVFPSDDLGIRQIISQLYLRGRPAKRRDIERVAKRWGSVGALVQYFLMCAQVLGLV
ncbi:MAG: DNA-3-methyladenine glycosylase family protein [Candidatus Hermodarchaeota archaeon]